MHCHSRTGLSGNLNPGFLTHVRRRTSSSSRTVLGALSAGVKAFRNDRKKINSPNSGNKLFTLVFLFILGMMTFEIPLAQAMARKPSTYSISVRVDFGPAGKAPHEETLEVEKGTTPKEAVSQVFPVLSGKTCCSPREIMGIDGVNVDPAKNRWWTCQVNGSKKVSPQKKKLKPGDRVEWKYIEDSQ